MNCQNCGSPLVQGAQFCTHCGAKIAQPLAQEQPPQQAAPSQLYPSQPIYGNQAQPITQAAPATVRPELQENPIRAMILAASLAAAILVSTFFVLGWDGTSAGYLKVLFTGLVACGVYLIMKPGVLPKIIAGAIALFAPLFYANAFAIFQASRVKMAFEPFALLQPNFFPYFTNNLMYAVCIIAIAFGFSFFIKRISKHQAAFAGLCIGSASIVLVFLLALPSVFTSGIQIALMRMVSEIPTALTLGFGTVVIYLLCTMKSYDLDTRTGHKIWFGLCLTFTTLSFIITFLGSVVGAMYFEYSGFILALLTITGIVGYTLLLMSKRLGYVLILIATGTMFFGSLILNFSQFSSMIFINSGPALLYLANIASSLSIVVNPTITGIVLLFIWKKIPLLKPYTKPNVSPLFKVFSIAGTSIGSILFLVGSSEFFNLFAKRSLGTLPSVSFLCGVFFGAATLVVGIFAILACFRKESKAPKGLLITNLVTTILAVLFLIVIIVT